MPSYLQSNSQGTPQGLAALGPSGYRGPNNVNTIGRGGIDFSGFPGAGGPQMGGPPMGGPPAGLPGMPNMGLPSTGQNAFGPPPNLPAGGGPPPDMTSGVPPGFMNGPPPPPSGITGGWDNRGAFPSPDVLNRLYPGMVR